MVTAVTTVTLLMAAYLVGMQLSLWIPHNRNFPNHENAPGLVSRTELSPMSRRTPLALLSSLSLLSNRGWEPGRHGLKRVADACYGNLAPSGGFRVAR